MVGLCDIDVSLIAIFLKVSSSRFEENGGGIITSPAVQSETTAIAKTQVDGGFLSDSALMHSK